MATKKISELTTTDTPSGGALFPIVQSSSNLAVTLTNIAANLPDVTTTKLTSSSTITASSGFVGNLTGTASAATLAASATALATGRTIALTGDVTYTSGSFDGTGNVTGTASIGSGVIVNADVNSSAAIAFSKMANLTASRALVSDGSGDVSISAVTSTEVGYLDGVSSAIQTQLDGKASSSYVPTTITVADESTDTTCFPLFVTAATGDLPPKSGSNLAFNSGTGALTATSFVGNLTGNVTGNTSGTSGSTTGNAATATILATARNIGGVSFNGSASIDLPGVNTSGNQSTSGTAAIATAVTVADESTDTTCNVLFTTAATGDLPPKSGTNLTFNSNSGVLTATGFAGNLTGNVTGNTSGSSGSTTGNAATATILATARDIGGVSFNGSASINLPGVNTSGSQNTSGTAAGLSSTLAVGSGGTGATSLTANGALIGNGTGAVTAVDMSTKGKLLAGDGSGNPSALSVGTNTHVLTADSSEATGLKWAAASGGTPTDITVADESSDTTCFPLFVTAATGDLGPKTGSNLAFNSSSGLLTATSFEGALDLNGAELILDADADTSITADTDDRVDLKIGGSDQVQFFGSGQILFGKTTNNFGTAGVTFNDTGAKNGAVEMIASGTAPLAINRLSSDGDMIVFHKDSSSGGKIEGGASSTAYLTSSDYRLKENVDYTFDATTRLKQLKPCRFNFKIDADKTVDGFLAHEVSSVVPEAISGEKDGEEMQCIDQSKLVPLLVKTIQELEARITTLEG